MGKMRWIYARNKKSTKLIDCVRFKASYIIIRINFTDRDYRNNGSVQTSDDESFNDNASVVSNFSEVRSTDDGTDEVDEISQQEAFEEKLSEAVDGLTQKSAQGRCNCLEIICKALIKKYIPTYVLDRKLTLCDAVERCLKKGKEAEQAYAAQLAILLCVQLGALQDCEEVCRILKPVLLQTVNDKSVSATTRGKCCTALSLVTFLAGGEMGDVLHLMQQFEYIFSGSYLKGTGSVPNISADLAILHSTALSAWTLLFTLMSPGDVYRMLDNGGGFNPSLTQLSELLKSGHLEVRMSAGEALATVFELGCDYQDDFGENLKDDLVEVLHQLATDSHKYRAKKDRKQQRATFRDVLHYIESGEVPELQIKFGQECLMLDSWLRRKQYDALCCILGPGINIHLSENDLLRDIFQLGTKILINDISIQRQTKLERHLVNAAAFKARTISRSKNRDKRSDF
ncbi:interferon-related developmental regulator [Holotrichia oblita]|uniref:Interferon-related developmental regulator n=1 Tax=Holotrichia oblita TaxID=644536 RepID=A0ACB9T0V9_HOLOL|nr:interferon-related developmental regulator [Holotrichia oblita]